MAMAPGRLSPAGADLGLGNMLVQQVTDETEEERKKRLARERSMGTMSPAASALGLGGFSGIGQ